MCFPVEGNTVVDLQSTEPSPERDEKWQQLKTIFTLVLSADYQMSKLLPYWGRSPQPSSTYYLQKVSYDIFVIVDHRDGVGHLYILNETIGPKILTILCPIYSTTLSLLWLFLTGFGEFIYLWITLVTQIKINI